MTYKKVSIKDIAKKAGVSIATVSYVLSKGKNSRVSAPMTEKIKKLAKELNYQPNQIAKSLKSGKTYTIGLIVADISNPFFAQIARIIEDEAAKSDYIVIFGSSDEKASKSWKLIQFFFNRQVDGFIIAPTENSEEQIKYLEEQNKPFVLIDRHFPDLDSNYVGIDNFGASYQVVNRLIETGNKKIGIIAYTNSLHHMRERIRGYKKAMADSGLKILDKWLKEINFSEVDREVKAGIEDLLSAKEPVDAIFFATNTLAVHGLKHLNMLRYKIPDDVAIVCFDEGEAFDFFYCPITYVRQPIVEMSKRAVEILTNQISDPSSNLQHVSLDGELVIHKSCSRHESKPIGT